MEENDKNIKLTGNDNCHFERIVIPPICGRCKKSWEGYVPAEKETIKYKTIGGRINTAYYCFDCQKYDKTDDFISLY